MASYALEMIKITETLKARTKPDFSNLGFGKYFSDHMFLLNYTKNKGWHDPRIEPYAALLIDPAASVLHYGQALFEGMKTFKHKSGEVYLFRPSFNAHRLQQGADRLCMQAPSTEIMLKGFHALSKIDQGWIPTNKGSSLYLRPTLIGTEGFLGVRPSDEYLFYVIASPVGAYYKEGVSPIRIWVEEKYTRAAPGGLGFTKAGANYASSLKAALDAKQKGYSQVLWLDTTKKKIEEVGTMNVFFVIKDKVITPALEGTILSGGIRACTIQLLKHFGYEVEERPLQIEEVIKAYKDNQLKEVFGTGTAAVISPVGELANDHIKMTINNSKMGPISHKLYSEITDIQHGDKPDIFGWLEKVQ